VFLKNQENEKKFECRKGTTVGVRDICKRLQHDRFFAVLSLIISF